MPGGPIDGNALVLAAARASVSGERLPELAERVQRVLGVRLPAYDRQYESVYEDESLVVFFVEEGHWADIGDEHCFDDREWKAVRRAHREHLKQLGSDLDRSQEFTTALDLREAVVVGKRPN